MNHHLEIRFCSRGPFLEQATLDSFYTVHCANAKIKVRIGSKSAKIDHLTF